MFCFSIAKAVQDNSDDLVELEDNFNPAFQEAQQTEDVLAAGTGERNPVLDSFAPVIASANDTSNVWWIFSKPLTSCTMLPFD